MRLPKGVIRAGKGIAVMAGAIGVVLLPLNLWQDAEFAAKKGWLWKLIGKTALAPAVRVGKLLPSLLVVAGVVAFAWLILLDRRWRRQDAGAPVHEPGPERSPPLIASGAVEPESIRDRLHGGQGPIFPRPGDKNFRPPAARPEAGSPQDSEQAQLERSEVEHNTPSLVRLAGGNGEPFDGIRIIRQAGTGAVTSAKIKSLMVESLSDLPLKNVVVAITETRPSVASRPPIRLNWEETGKTSGELGPRGKAFVILHMIEPMKDGKWVTGFATSATYLDSIELTIEAWADGSASDRHRFRLLHMQGQLVEYPQITEFDSSPVG